MDISKIQLIDGTYNIKDETAREQIQNIQNSLNERIVCVGDSYGVGTTYNDTIDGWCDRLKTLMNLTNDNYYKFVEGSAGFTRTGLQGHNFITLLQTNISNIQNKETITKVIVCGGHNEYESNDNSLNSAIEYFITYCKEQFPKAKVYVGMLGNNSANSNFGITVRNAISSFILRCYQNCVRYGGIYLSGIQNIMHDYPFFMSDDNIHPNNLGYAYLASYIYQSLLGNYADYISKEITETFTATNSASTFQITSQLINDNLQFRFNQITINYTSPINWNSGGHLEIANHNPSRFRWHNADIKIPIIFYVTTSDNKFYGGTGLLQFNDTYISIRNVLLKNDGSAYFNIENITGLVIQPSNILVPNIIC